MNVTSTNSTNTSFFSALPSIRCGKVIDVVHRASMAGSVAFALMKIAGMAVSTPLGLSLGTLIGIPAIKLGKKIYEKVCTPVSVSQNHATVDVGQCYGFPTEHCADTEIYRNALIDAAEENIVISGNFCGGTTFADMLKRIEKRLQTNQKLKVLITSFPFFSKNSKELREQVATLSKDFADRFSFVESPAIILFDKNQSIKRMIKVSTNHTKCTVIDNGKIFILGGSGIQNNFTQTGLNSLTKEEFRKTRQLTEVDSKDASEIESDFYQYAFGDFRDMDFVFSSPDSTIGKRVYEQTLHICKQWEEYNKKLDPSKSSSSVLEQMHKAVKNYDVITNAELVKLFDERKRCKVDFKLMACGPELHDNVFSNVLLEDIKNAKEEIIIKHQYFQPSAAIMQALIDTAKRNVKIKIITCGATTNAPKSQLFVARNKDNCAYLVSSLPKEFQSNVEVFEFDQNQVSFHKKVVIIDGKIVIGGSSNLGFKSLETMSDHELNFRAVSQEFATRTKAVSEIDIKHSRKVEDPTKISLCERISAAGLGLIVRVIG